MRWGLVALVRWMERSGRGFLSPSGLAFLAPPTPSRATHTDTHPPTPRRRNPTRTEGDGEGGGGGDEEREEEGVVRGDEEAVELRVAGVRGRRQLPQIPHHQHVLAQHLAVHAVELSID